MKKRLFSVVLAVFYNITVFSQVAHGIKPNDKGEYKSLWHSLEAILIALAIIAGIFLAKRWAKKIEKKRDSSIEKWKKGKSTNK